MNRRIIIALVAALASLAIGAGAAAARQPQLHLGSVYAYSGTGAPYGVGQINGERLAVRQINAAARRSGLTVKMDSAAIDSSSDSAIAAVASMISSGAQAILGPTLSSQAAAALPPAVAAKIPSIGVTNATLSLTGLRPYVWRVSAAEDRMIRASVDVAHDELGIRTAVIVADPNNGYSAGAEQSFERAAARSGVTILAVIPCATGSDPTAALQAAAETGAQAIFSGAIGSDPQAVVTARKTLGLTQLLVGGNGFNAPDLPGTPGAAGTVVGASWNAIGANAASKRFVRSYRRAFKLAPDTFAAQGFASVELAAAAARAGKGTSAAAIQRGLGRLRRVPTVLGKITFRSGEARYPVVVQQVKGGKFVPIARRAG
ncbi:unannotated protein [freshwater metagenome]|uniref:Unannotated protein n=1 Tax=freshwater metagenome TaxID=449393 RepID=A0A6J7IAE4_9ZZZZ